MKWLQDPDTLRFLNIIQEEQAQRASNSMNAQTSTMDYSFMAQPYAGCPRMVSNVTDIRTVPVLQDDAFTTNELCAPVIDADTTSARVAAILASDFPTVNSAFLNSVVTNAVAALATAGISPAKREQPTLVLSDNLDRMSDVLTRLALNE